MNRKTKSVMVSLVCAVALLAAAGCGGSSSDEAKQTKNAYKLTLDPAGLTLTLYRNAEPLLAFDSNSIQLGRVDALEEKKNYSPTFFFVDDGVTQPPEGFKWLKLTGAQIAENTAAKITANLQFEDGKAATLTIEPKSEFNYKLTLTPSASGDAIAYIRLAPKADADEGFYGLGGFLDQTNHRGKVRAMQLEAETALESGYNEMHVPVPLLIGTKGWGMFLKTRFPTTFSVAASSPDVVDAIVGTAFGSADGLEFYLYAADKPIDITKQYYESTVYPTLPAAWALGPWIWRDEAYGQATVESDLKKIRELRLATSGYWIDRPYASCVNSFDYDPKDYTDSKAMIKLAHDLGFRMALWHTPYIEDNCAASAELLKRANDEGYFPPKSGLRLNKWGTALDFTNKAAYDWWQSLIRNYTDNGIEGFKLDYAEDVVPGIFGSRNEWKFADGSDERTMHSTYTLLYHKVYAETLPKSGYFLLGRAGKWGDQQYVTVIWPGDLDATFWAHRQVKPDDGKLAVGGLPASVIYGVTLGPSGFPFFGADTGGYRSSPPNKEVFTRWFQQTALSSVMQVGTSTNDVAWEFRKDNGFDEEMLGWYKQFTSLHLRLFPYEWTLAQNILKDGRPIQRPLGLAYPELGSHPSDQYMFGDDLLVAPVVVQGATTKDVVFPAGGWADWFTGEVYAGGQTINVSAPLSKLPLYLREGGIVPLLRPSVDTLAPTTKPGEVDSYETDAGVLYPRIYIGAKSSINLFDGSSLSQEKTGTGATLYYKDGAKFKSGALYELIAYGAAEPAKVTDNGTELVKKANLDELEKAASGYFYTNANNGSLYVKVGSGEHAVKIYN